MRARAAIDLIRATAPEIYPPVNSVGVVRLRPEGLDALYPNPDEDLDRNTQVLVSYGSADQLAHELRPYAPELAAWIRRGRWLGQLAYLHSISIATPLQGQGLGDALLHQTLAALRPLGISRGFLHAAGDTPALTRRLVRWYQRHGFVLVPATDQLGRHRHPGMIKRL
jgi:ribosomal protein S18 acetylase RimI-like enzyme